METTGSAYRGLNNYNGALVCFTVMTRTSVKPLLKQASIERGALTLKGYCQDPFKNSVELRV